MEALAAKMIELYNHPDSVALQTELNIGPDILDPQIRQAELRNWIDNLVLPSRNR